MNVGLPRVRVVATGGTIANTAHGRLSVSDVLESIRTADPGAAAERHAAITVADILREGAETFTPRDWLLIARAVESCANDASVDGIVVTHGTVTVEETAYFVHLTVRTLKPIVFAVSHRLHQSISSDGDRNLIDAVRVAAQPEARGRGVVIVANEQIHSARDATKTSQRPGGFTSHRSGILGSIDADRISFYRRLERRHTATSAFELPDKADLPRVDVVAVYAGADDVAVRAFLAAKTRGLVVNGFAYTGQPHPNQLSSLREATASGVPVVLVSRGADGRVPNVEADSFVRGDDLSAQKARVLLTLALLVTSDPGEIQRLFDEH